MYKQQNHASNKQTKCSMNDPMFGTVWLHYRATPRKWCQSTTAFLR